MWKSIVPFFTCSPQLLGLLVSGSAWNHLKKHSSVSHITKVAYCKISGFEGGFFSSSTPQPLTITFWPIHVLYSKIKLNWKYFKFHLQKLRRSSSFLLKKTPKFLPNENFQVKLTKVFKFWSNWNAGRAYKSSCFGIRFGQSNQSNIFNKHMLAIFFLKTKPHYKRIFFYF